GGDVFAILALALYHPGGHHVADFIKALPVVLITNEPLHPQTFSQDGAHQQREALRAVRQIGTAIAADQAAYRHTRCAVKQGEYGVEDCAADVFIIDIDTLWAGVFQLFSKIVRTVIDAGIKAQFLYCVAAFFFSASNAHYTAAFQLTNLSDG